MRTLAKGAQLLAFSVALVACGRTDRAPRPTMSTDGTRGGASGGGATSTGSQSGAAGDGAVDACTGEPDSLVPAPIARLGNDQLNRTFRSLLPPPSADTLPRLPESSWENDPSSPLNPDTLRQVHDIAHAVAPRLTEDTSSSGWLAACDATAQGDAACRDELTKSLLARVYRRPAAAEDLQEMAEVFDTGKRIGGDFKQGMRAIAEAALQSADFLYLLERGTGKDVDGATELTGYETAARLAYFLTRSPPDADLTAAAARGPLSLDAVEEHARRLLASADGRVGLSQYYGQQLGLGGRLLGGAAEELTAPLAEAANEASRRFIEDALFGDDSLGVLLTDPSVWTEESLASFYGYPLGGADWQKVKLAPARSAGVFTQPAFFIGLGVRSGSAVLRGVRVLSRLLCEEPLPPPADVPPVLPEPSPTPLSGRQLLERETAPVACADCHRDMNTLGFAFEHYDATGRWRDVDNGFPIDASGQLEREDLRGAFTGAEELMELLSQSDTVKRCFVTTWLEAGYGRSLGDADECRVRELALAWEASEGQAVELLVEIAKSPRFRYRPTSELGP